MLTGLILQQGDSIYRATKAELQAAGIDFLVFRIRQDGQRDDQDISVFREWAKLTGLPYGWWMVYDYTDTTGKSGLVTARDVWDRMDKEKEQIGRKSLPVWLICEGFGSAALPSDKKPSYLGNLEAFYDEYLTHFGRRPVAVLNPSLINGYFVPTPGWMAKCPLGIAHFVAKPLDTYGPWPRWTFWWKSGKTFNTTYATSVGLVEFPGTLTDMSAWIGNENYVLPAPDWSPVTPPVEHTCPTGQHWDEAAGKCVDDVVVVPPVTPPSTVTFDVTVRGLSADQAAVVVQGVEAMLGDESKG